MSADAPPPFGDMPESSAPADTQSGQTAPTVNGNSLKDSMVNSGVRGQCWTTSPCLQRIPANIFLLSLLPHPSFPYLTPPPDAAAAMNTISNHPATQNTKETLTQGPVAESVKNESAKTSNDISGLANSRVQPDATAADGQPLTHYHSFFYTLLSWQHPRATAISFATSVLFIFASRYLPLLRWVFKISYLAFGVTALAEIVGKFVMGTGVTASFRPRKYYRVPKETLETFLDDVEQLINFFVIEFQRILFAENPAATVGAFLSAFVSYYLIKIVPFWGLTLLSTCVIYLAPLIYLKNKDVIDGQLEHASGVISAQTNQIKDIAGERTSKGFESMKQYTGDYAAKAQDLMGSARQKMPAAAGGQSKPALTEKEFPAAPKNEPVQEKPEAGSADGPIAAN